jgi:hypothetical protein
MPVEGYGKKDKTEAIEPSDEEKEPNSNEQPDQEEETDTHEPARRGQALSGHEKRPNSSDQNDLAKEPSFLEQSDQAKEPSSIEQIHLKLEAIHHYRLFKFMRKHTVFDAWLAGGDGATLLRKARQGALNVARGA